MKKAFRYLFVVLIIVMFSFTCRSYITNAAKITLDNVSGMNVQQTTSSITLSWKKVSGADGYRIMKKVGGKWYEYGTTKATSFIINNLSSATKHTFGVRAFKKTKNKTILSEKGNRITAGTAPSNVSKLKSSPDGQTLKLSWEKVKRADGYKIYKYNSSKDKWESITETKKTSYTVKNLKHGTSYTFAVKAYFKVSKQTVFSTDYKKIKYTCPVEKTKVSVATGSSAFSGEKTLIVDIDGSNWSGQFVSNTLSLPAYVDGKNTGKSVKCTLNDKPDGVNNYTITIDVSNINLSPGAIISISFPEGFIQTKDGKQYSSSFAIKSTY